MFLAFNHHGCGHYDALIYESKLEPVTNDKVSKTLGCTCGRGDKGISDHCVVKQAKYTVVIRCPCLKRKIPCTNDCSCKNCHNEFGTKHAETSKRRHRERHQWQLQIRNTIQSGIGMCENMQTGSRTMCEFFVLEEILSYCTQHTIERNADNVHIIYSAVQEVSRGLEITT